MKNAYFFSALAASLAAAPAAQAQQAWQPFRAGTIYQYSETATPGDTTHTLQLGPGAAVAGTADTVYRFNRRAPKPNVQQFQPGNGSDYQLVADNLFGATLRAQPGAVFVLAAANGRTLTLRPRAPLGQSWAAGPAGLVAHVMSRGVTQVLGRPDSVALIMLSDGQDIRLSKRHGLLDGPSLDSYLNGRNRRRALVLTALSAAGRAVGPLVVGERATFDFQPGDVFQRHGSGGAFGSVCTEIWTQDSIISRTPSRTGDSVSYAIRTRTLYRNYGQAGAPFGFCSATGSGYSATTATRLVTNVVGIRNQQVRALTNAFAGSGSSTAAGFGEVTGPAVRSARYFRRPEWEQQLCNLPSGSGPIADSARLQMVLDNGRSIRYALGLGITCSITSSFDQTTVTELVAYRKGSETWGIMFIFRQLLATRATRPAASTTAFPQPFGASLAVKFDLARPQAVRLALHDALGRTVMVRPAAAAAAGSQQLVLDTQVLPAGLYTLHIGLLGEGRTEVLKVLKAE